jgi:hypothetical protein
MQTQSFGMMEIVHSGIVRVCGFLLDSNTESSIYGALSLLLFLTGTDDEDVIEAIGGD